MSPAGLAVLVSVLSMAWSGMAAAQAGPRITLRWNAPDSCPDDLAVIGAVESLLGRPMADAGRQQLAVSIHVHGAPGGFAARLTLTNTSGSEQRFLEHPDCAKLVEAVALVTALAIDPEGVRAREQQQAHAPAEAAASEPAAVAPVVLAPQSQPAAPPASAPIAQPSAPPRPPATSTAVVGVQALLGAGSLPGVRPGFAAELGLRQRWFVAQAVARYWASGSADVPDAPPASVELGLMSLGVRGCAVSSGGEWRVRTCVGADFGDLRGIGQNVGNARARHALLPTLEASLALAFARWQVAPLGGLALAVPLARPSFGVLEGDSQHEAFRPAPVAFLGFVGVAYGL